MEAIGEFIPDRAALPAGPAMSSRLPLAVVSGAADVAGGTVNGAAGDGAVTGAADSAVKGPADSPASSEAGDVVDAALALLRSWIPTAGAEAARFGLVEAADFAGKVEELSRTTEFLQLIAAGAVDRTRKLSAATETAATGWGADGAAGWLTGWTQAADDRPGAGTDAAAAGAAAASGTGAGGGLAGPCCPVTGCRVCRGG